MKIEKINDNQIRCTLTHADLEARHLKLSELAYGTENAKALFQDVMQQASFDFGFELDNMPLMIEAIPSSADSIVLIITKVEDPEELDTRFSRFTPSGEAEKSLTDSIEKLDGAEDFMNLLNKVTKAASEISTPEPEEKSAEPLSVRLFSFDTMDLVIDAAHLVNPVYNGSNTLYYNSTDEEYLLALTQSGHSAKEFNKICNMLSEYGSVEKVSAATLAFLEEHYDIIISSDALQKLADI